jgi:hypothetical protein
MLRRKNYYVRSLTPRIRVYPCRLDVRIGNSGRFPHLYEPGRTQETAFAQVVWRRFLHLKQPFCLYIIFLCVGRSMDTPGRVETASKAFTPKQCLFGHRFHTV